MRTCRVAKVGLFLGACLMATSASAKPKLRSINALARALAAKLPTKPGVLVYVAPPRWKGKKKGQSGHDALCAKIGTELAKAISVADPTAKVVTRAQAEAALPKHGLQTLDAYGRGNLMAALLGSWEGREAIAITGDIDVRGGGFELTEEAQESRQRKRIAKLTAFLPKTQQLQTLFAAPDVPIKDSAGVYLADVGGVGVPTCIRCVNPYFPSVARLVSAGVTLAFTVGANGGVSGVEVVGVTTKDHGRAFAQVAAHAVLAWSFKPATGPDGKPVAVRMFAEIQFNPR